MVSLDLYTANVSLGDQVIYEILNLIKYLCILLNIIEYNNFIMRHIVTFSRNGHNLALRAKNNTFILVNTN